jgi:hypothetical protein
VLTGPALAQAPKKFEWFEETVDLGFKIRRPEGWDLIPPNPDERQMLAKFTPPFQYVINVGPDDRLFLHGWLVKFDRRKDAEGQPRRPRHQDVRSWIKAERETGATGWTLIEQERLKGVGVPATAYLFEGPNLNGPNRPPVRCYAAHYTITADLEVAMIFNGPPEKTWRKYGQAFEKMARSFALVPLAEVDHADADAPGSGSLRAQKRHLLEEEVARTPEWALYETSNYFVVSNNDDDDFIDEVLERLEAIRAVYEEQYPPEKARRAKAPPKTPVPEGEVQPGAEDAPEEGAEPAPDEDLRSTSVQADPLEQSRTSVVRVCATEKQYYGYGGSPGTAGYWYDRHEELVLYDDQADMGRNFTWLVMNHEAFHQYIYYFYGNIAPHSWYNEGTGDYFSGFEYKRKKFVEDKPRLRELEIQQMIRAGEYAPLKDFVRWTKSEYYGSNDLEIPGYRCYAQGWSLIWFLRTGDRRKAPGWNDDWNAILDIYLLTLADTGDLDQAVDKAFAGVDWEAFEASWKAYIE